MAGKEKFAKPKVGPLKPPNPNPRNPKSMLRTQAREKALGTFNASIAAGSVPEGTPVSFSGDQLHPYWLPPDPILGAGFVTSRSSFNQRNQAKAEERLRFLREQTRRGRLSTVLSGGSRQASASGGFQLGRKTLLGG